MTAPPLLEMRSITKTFGGVVACQDISINLQKGEVLGLCGENGAGKSTLMKILSGSYSHRSYRGDILIDGSTQSFTTTRDAEAAGIEMIYQEISLHPDLSVAENVFLGQLPHNRWGVVDWARVRRDAKAALARVGLDVDVENPTRQVSTSQQQMVAIARSCTRDPRILVLDEPTSALTVSETRRLFQIIRELRNRGISCIYISHKLEEVFEICDRVTVIRDGHHVSTRRSSDTDPARLITEMVGRDLQRSTERDATAPGRKVLEVRDISAPHPSKPGQHIARDVSFSLCAGEILGFAGLVGAGRSELMTALFDGSYRKVSSPNARVVLDDREIEIRSPSDAIRRGIALLTEDRKASGFVGTLDLTRNISLTALRKISRAGLIKRRRERALVRELADKLNIRSPGLDVVPLHLSGGNQQKVVVAKWLFAEPRILILDEPTRGIDVGAKAEIYRLMDALAASGVGIILISSEMPELIAMSDRIAVLGNGRIQEIFDRDDATQEKILEAASRGAEHQTGSAA